MGNKKDLLHRCSCIKNKMYLRRSTWATRRIYCIGALVLRIRCILGGVQRSRSTFRVSFVLLVGVIVMCRTWSLASSEFYQELTLRKMSVASFRSPNYHLRSVRHAKRKPPKPWKKE